MAPGNVALALAILATAAWRLKAARGGERFTAPFRGRAAAILTPIAWFAALSFLSAFFSTSPARSVPQVKGLWSFLLLPLAVALLRTAADAAVVASMWAIDIAYLSARGLAEFASGADNLGQRLAGGLSVYMTFAGVLLAMGLVVAGRALDESRRARARVLDGALAVLAAGAVGLTFTRTAYVAFLAGALVLLASARPRLLAVLPVLAGLLFVAMPRGVRERALTSFATPDETARDRFAMWRAGALMIGDRPLFGLGPKRVKDLYPVYRQPGHVDPHPGHLHNNVIMTAAETGIPSALAYLAFVAAFGAHATRRLRAAPRGTRERALVAGALAAFAGLTVFGLFEYNFGDVEVLRVLLVAAALPFAIAPVPGETAS